MARAKKDDPVAITIATYDQIVKAQSEHYGQDITPYGELTQKFISHLHGKTILDAGCGNGYYAKYFHQKGYTVTAIDLSKSMVNFTKQNCPDCMVEKMDIRKLSLPNKSFAGIWAMMSVLHLPRSEAPIALAEFHRVLEPGGTLYVSVKAGSGEKYLTKDYYNGHKKFFCYWDLADFQEVVAAAGFAVIDHRSGKGITHEENIIDIFARKPD